VPEITHIYSQGSLLLNSYQDNIIRNIFENRCELARFSPFHSIRYAMVANPVVVAIVFDGGGPYYISIGHVIGNYGLGDQYC
jgi:hypothetical protein